LLLSFSGKKLGISVEIKYLNVPPGLGVPAAAVVAVLPPLVPAAVVAVLPPLALAAVVAVLPPPEPAEFLLSPPQLTANRIVASSTVLAVANRRRSLVIVDPPVVNDA
jgi:hypothetical protein